MATPYPMGAGFAEGWMQGVERKKQENEAEWKKQEYLAEKGDKQLQFLWQLRESYLNADTPEKANQIKGMFDEYTKMTGVKSAPLGEWKPPTKPKMGARDMAQKILDTRKDIPAEALPVLYGMVQKDEFPAGWDDYFNKAMQGQGQTTGQTTGSPVPQQPSSEPSPFQQPKPFDPTALTAQGLKPPETPWQNPQVGGANPFKGVTPSAGLSPIATVPSIPPQVAPTGGQPQPTGFGGFFAKPEIGLVEAMQAVRLNKNSTPQAQARMAKAYPVLVRAGLADEAVWEDERRTENAKIFTHSLDKVHEYVLYTPNKTPEERTKSMVPLLMNMYRTLGMNITEDEIGAWIGGQEGYTWVEKTKKEQADRRLSIDQEELNWKKANAKIEQSLERFRNATGRMNAVTNKEQKARIAKSPQFIAQKHSDISDIIGWETQARQHKDDVAMGQDANGKLTKEQSARLLTLANNKATMAKRLRMAYKGLYGEDAPISADAGGSGQVSAFSPTLESNLTQSASAAKKSGMSFATWEKQIRAKKVPGQPDPTKFNKVDMQKVWDAS
jgi:hypothetical protein